MSAASTASAAPARSGSTGEIVRGCLMLAVQADGLRVETIEGLAESGEIADLQEPSSSATRSSAAIARRACCSPRPSCSRRRPRPSRAEIRAYLSGNYCRCTGYQAIVDAIEAVAARRPGG